MSAKPNLRLPALRRFAIAITVLNILGHSVLGFEASPAHAFAALATAYTLELVFEWLRAREHGEQPRFVGGFRAFVDFLLPAHISGLAVSMLLYSQERLMPIVFAAAVAIGSKVLVRATVKGRKRHIFNPSNFGIAVTLLAFSDSVGVIPIYQFTETTHGVIDWVIPCVIICTGSLLNARLTRRMPLIAGWVGGYVAQAFVRSALFHTPAVSSLGQLTGVAFLLFTFYMISDPGTTPSKRMSQVAFGAAVAAVYGVLVSLHLVFGMFLSLVLVCGVRGLYLALAPHMSFVPSWRTPPALSPEFLTRLQTKDAGNAH